MFLLVILVLFFVLGGEKLISQKVIGTVPVVQASFLKKTKEHSPYMPDEYYVEDLDEKGFEDYGDFINKDFERTVKMTFDRKVIKKENGFCIISFCFTKEERDSFVSFVFNFLHEDYKKNKDKIGAINENDWQKVGMGIAPTEEDNFEFVYLQVFNSECIEFKILDK